MENWRVVVLSVACTLVVIITIILISMIVQTGVAKTIKEEVIDDYCNSISITEARDLEVCK